MGVNGLLLLLKSIQRPCHLRDFAGKTLGVDVYGWLHRGAVACAMDLALGKPTSKFVDFTMHRVRMLYHFGVTPYLVFDGDNLPSKAGTEHERAARRKEARKVGEELLRLGKAAQAYEELKKAVDVTPEMARQLIEELKKYQVKYVVAPYEADSQLTYLEKSGLVDGIISEDSDLLVFGVKTLITKLDQYGECIKIRQDEFNACREVSFAGLQLEHFRTMAILSGCDYLRGIPKMGLKTAHRFVRKCKSAPNPVERIIQCAQLEGKLCVPPNYLANFDQAEKTFLYQWVFNPVDQTLVNLHLLPKDVKLEDLPFIGAFIEPEIARLVANGTLNPTTKLPIPFRSIPTLAKSSSAGTKLGKAISPLKPKLPKVAFEGKKSIEAFFKPVRTPLAELDPNTLTPSPRQRELLERYQGRTWPGTPAPLVRSMTEPRAGSSLVEAMMQPIGSAPAPLATKRQRLCREEEDLPTPEDRAETQSRFFSATEPSPSVAVGVRKNKKAKRGDIQIWSDDSIEDAMAEILDIRPSLARSKTGFPPPKKFAVFKDDAAENTDSKFFTTQAPNAARSDLISQKTAPIGRAFFNRYKLPEPDLPIAGAGDGSTNQSRCSVVTDKAPSTPGQDAAELRSFETPFHENLMAETRALGQRFGHSAAQDCTDPETHPAKAGVEPMTPPATSKEHVDPKDSPPDQESAVKETPHPHEGQASPAEATHLVVSPLSKVTPADQRQPPPPSDDIQLLRTLKAKGSEDHIIPDSESDSGAEYPSPTNSPSRARVAGEAPEDGVRVRPMLNLKQFVFSQA